MCSSSQFDTGGLVIVCIVSCSGVGYLRSSVYLSPPPRCGIFMKIFCLAHVVVSLVVPTSIVSFMYRLWYSCCCMQTSHRPDCHTPHFMDKCTEGKSGPLPIPVNPAGQLACHIRGEHHSGALQEFLTIGRDTITKAFLLCVFSYLACTCKG